MSITSAGGNSAYYDPLLVKQVGTKYEIVDGQARFNAAKISVIQPKQHKPTLADRLAREAKERSKGKRRKYGRL